MVGPLRVAEPHTPSHLSEHQDKQEKEDACHFEEEDATHPAKGPNETAQSAGDVSRYLAGLAAAGAN